MFQPCFHVAGRAPASSELQDCGAGLSGASQRKRLAWLSENSNFVQHSCRP